MTKERTSNERFEIVGLSRAEVDRCMEVLCGGPVRWDRGYCVASSELFARPSRYGPEPSNEGRKPMSDESRSTSKDLSNILMDRDFGDCTASGERRK